MALAFVRYSFSDDSDPGTTLATAASVLTAGNLLIVGVRSGDQPISSVADTAGNTFNALTAYPSSGDPRVRLFYAQNVTGHATNVVTATFVGGDFHAVIAAEFSGAALSSSFDAEAGGATTTTTLSSPALTTTNANDVVFVCGSQGAGAVYTQGSGYTLIDGTMGDSAVVDYFGAEYKIVSSTIGGVAQTIISDVSNAGTIAVAAFKEFSVGGAVQTFARNPQRNRRHTGRYM